MARSHQDRAESRGNYRSMPPYAEIQKQIGKGLKQQYELPQQLPHRLLALLMQLNDNEDDDG